MDVYRTDGDAFQVDTDSGSWVFRPSRLAGHVELVTYWPENAETLAKAADAGRAAVLWVAYGID